MSYLTFSSVNILVWMCDQDLPGIFPPFIVCAFLICLEDLMQDVEGLVIVWSDNASTSSYCNNNASSSGGLPVNPNLIASLKRPEFASLQKVVASPNGLIVDNFFQVIPFSLLSNLN
jgi:hypothetical protein